MEFNIISRLSKLGYTQDLATLDCYTAWKFLILSDEQHAIDREAMKK